MQRIGLCLLLTVCAGPALATTVVAMSADQVLERASTTVLGEVVAIEAGETEDGVIYTEISLRVEECFFSSEVEKIGETYQFADGIFTFRRWGGQLGERKLMIHGTSSFELGERVLVAVEQAPDAPARFCVGLAQGKYSLKDGRARREMAGLELVDEMTGEHREGEMDETPEPELLDYVREHYRARKTAGEGR